MTAKAARNSRSNTRVSLMFAAVAAQATGTPSPVVAMWYLVPCAVGRIGSGQITAPLGPHRAGVEDQRRIAAQHADQDGMNLRQYTGARPLLQMAAQGRTADLISGRFQTAPRRALSEKLTQGGQHPNRRRSGMAATLLGGGREKINNCRDELKNQKTHPLPPCLPPQTCSLQPNNPPHQG